MSYERQHHDRTDHERAARNRRRRRQRRGPSEDAINRALSEVAGHDLPGTPSVRALKVLRDAVGTPIEVNDRTVTDFRIQAGDPTHGEKRSDDHVSRYVVEYDATEPCPECGGHRRRFRYNAHHFIAGSESVWCLRCETQLDGRDWG